MDRTLIGSLLRPKHLAATLAVFLALGGLAGFVVGAAAAAEEDGVAGAFTFAAPLAGDRGHYELTGDSFFRIRDQTGLDFEVLPDAVAPDVLGRARTLNRVAVVELPAEEQFFAARVYRVDPTNGQTVAMERGLQEAEVEGGRTGTRDYIAVDFPQQDTGYEPPCGLRHELQGMTWDLSSHVAVMPCRFGPGPQNAGPWTWVAKAVASTGDVQHLRVDIEWGGAKRLTYEFRSDVPYPVVITYGRDGHDKTTATLTAFERGAQAIALSADPVGPPVLAIEQRPLTPWLVDDAGLAHPFPLSKAWAVALDDPVDPTFRDFLAAHPDAFVEQAIYNDFRQPGQADQRSWRFTVTDASQAIDVTVAEPIEPEAADPADPVATVQGLLGASGDEDPAASYTASIGPAREEVLDRAALPATLPSVASMMAMWSAFAGQDHADVAGHYVRIDVMCGETCSDYDLRLSVGSSFHTRDGDQDVSSSSTLEWWMFPARFPASVDQPMRYAEDTSTWGPAAAATTPGPQPAPPGLMASSVGRWMMPGAGATAGVGASALLAALAYWVWPVVKGGGLGLFSRVTKDRLLDNPLRQQLVQRIEAEPGVHHNALVRDLGKGKGAAEHHLDKLVAARLVLRHRGTGYTCYFPLGTDQRHMAASGATKADGARQILEAMRNGVTGVRAIAVATGLAPSTVSHHLERLRGAGLVTGSGKDGYHAMPGAGGAVPTAA